jgi:hypothetical protein
MFDDSSAPAGATFLAATNWQLAAGYAVTDFEIDIEVDSPFKALMTLITGRLLSYAAGSAPLIGIVGGGHRLASAFDGFTLTTSSAGLTGSLRVYGYNN